MALRALNSVIAANYNKEATDPMLAGDILMFSSDIMVRQFTHEHSSLAYVPMMVLELTQPVSIPP